MRGLGWQAVEAFEFKQIISKKVCPTCSEQFAVDDALTNCPKDGSLLAPFAEDPFIGQKLAESYEILALIGSGASGRVYKARQMPLDRMVAVKILQPHLTSDLDKVKRFEREAKSISRLVHDNIVRIYDYGLMLRPYMIMEYVQGERLDELIKKGPVEHARAIKIIDQVCDGLQYAHEQGMIHRDIKPANIMIVADAFGVERVKLLDFGLAKLLTEGQDVHDGLTKAGEMIGSPPYMSPEQFLGKKMDERSDVYSVGCVLYEMLTGQRLFKSDTTIGYLNKHSTESPAAFADVNRKIKVPASVELATRKALEKEPDDRYQSALEFKLGLEKSLANAGKTGSLAGKRSRSLRMVGVGAFLIVGILVGAWYTGIVPGYGWQYFCNAGDEAAKQKNYLKAEESYGTALKIMELYKPQDERLITSLEKLLSLYKKESKWALAAGINDRLLELKPETAKLGTYDKNGIAFSYPTTWKVQSIGKGDDIIFMYNFVSFIVTNYSVSSTLHWAQFSIVVSDEEVTRQEFAAHEDNINGHGLKNYSKIEAPADITFGANHDISGRQIIFSSEDMGRTICQRFIYFGKPGQLYKLAIQSEQVDFNHVSKVMDKILSTVRLTAGRPNFKYLRSKLGIADVTEEELDEGTNFLKNKLIEPVLGFMDEESPDRYYLKGMGDEAGDSYVEAEQAYNQAEALIKKGAKFESIDDLYFRRAMIRFQLGKNKESIEDFRKLLEDTKWDEEDDRDPYAAMVTSFAYQRLGETEKSKEMMDLAAQKMTKHNWLRVVVEYLQGKLSEKEMFAKVNKNSDRQRANFYVGYKALVAGDKSKAIDYFKWVVHNEECDGPAFEWITANYGLKKLAPSFSFETMRREEIKKAIRIRNQNK